MAILQNLRRDSWGLRVCLVEDPWKKRKGVTYAENTGRGQSARQILPRVVWSIGEWGGGGFTRDLRIPSPLWKSGGGDISNVLKEGFYKPSGQNIAQFWGSETERGSGRGSLKKGVLRFGWKN